MKRFFALFALSLMMVASYSEAVTCTPSVKLTVKRVCDTTYTTSVVRHCDTVVSGGHYELRCTLDTVRVPKLTCHYDTVKTTTVCLTPDSAQGGYVSAPVVDTAARTTLTLRTAVNVVSPTVVVTPVLAAAIVAPVENVPVRGVTVNLSSGLDSALTGAVLRISYSGFDLSSVKNGRVQIYYQTAPGAYQLVGGVMDSATKSVVATVTHFSTYVVMGVSKTSVVDGGIAGPAVNGLSITPNPLNAATSVFYSVANAGLVTVDIYGMDGRLVNRLTQGKVAQGAYRVSWNGADRNGWPMASGIYLVRMTAGKTVLNERAHLVR